MYLNVIWTGRSSVGWVINTQNPRFSGQLLVAAYELHVKVSLENWNPSHDQFIMNTRQKFKTVFVMYMSAS